MKDRIQLLFNWFFHPEFYRGTRAEQSFERACTAGGFIWQRITQDRISFVRQQSTGHGSAERGDYIIRNRSNYEVEVKCLRVRLERGKRGYFLAWGHIARHSDTAAMTGSPIFFAFYEPSGGRTVAEQSLRMISLERSRGGNGIKRPPGVAYVEKPAKGLFIPLDVLTPGFGELNGRHL